MKSTRCQFSANSVGNAHVVSMMSLIFHATHVTVFYFLGLLKKLGCCLAINAHKALNNTQAVTWADLQG